MSHILIVEDDRDIAELLQRFLTRAGHTTDALGDGSEALAFVRSRVPDLVILDLMLPGVDGLEVCRALRRGPDTRALPIIMLTARSEEADRIAGLELGADDYVTKPFSMRELVARVRAALRRQEMLTHSTEQPGFADGHLMIDLERPSVQAYFQAQADLMTICQAAADRLSETIELNYAAACGSGCC